LLHRRQIRHDHILHLVDHEPNLPFAIAHDDQHLVACPLAVDAENATSRKHGNSGVSVGKHAEQHRGRSGDRGERRLLDRLHRRREHEREMLGAVTQQEQLRERCATRIHHLETGIHWLLLSP
jgi:hypothetical protein